MDNRLTNNIRSSEITLSKVTLCNDYASNNFSGWDERSESILKSESATVNPSAVFFIRTT